MMFHKSTLSAWILAQALLQMSVYAYAPRANSEPYTVQMIYIPTTTTCTGYIFFTQGKPCKASCVRGDQGCDETIATCNEERTGFEECVDGELIFTECTAGQKCVPFGTKASCVRGDQEP
ncbi:hypothetical protein BB561_003244 [Smittium simulii]|uniref:Carbohydrate-binding module family 19 domain-containing protein n=1 Tax=Smittium simulii TaxID=133385 RepID=A0A2T9YME1_9FUNG|nr:hypothetical protein BB561_003244 [Smittium simulii]